LGEVEGSEVVKDSGLSTNLSLLNHPKLYLYLSQLRCAGIKKGSFTLVPEKINSNLMRKGCRRRSQVG